MAKAKKAGDKSQSKSLTAYLEDIQFGSLSMEDVLQGSSKNLEAIADANRAIIGGYSDLAKRQYEMLKELIEQLKEVAGDDSELSDKLKVILDMAKKDFQDLQKMASETNSQAQAILKKRTKANIDAWKKVIEETKARITKSEKKAKKSGAAGSVSKQSAARKTAATTAAAKPAPAKKAPAKKAPAKKAPAKAASAKTTPAKTTPAKKAPAKKAPVSAKPESGDTE